MACESDRRLHRGDRDVGRLLPLHRLLLAFVSIHDPGGVPRRERAGRKGTGHDSPWADDNIRCDGHAFRYQRPRADGR